MGNQDNIKNVMRTALVGVKPANQVILKGYLRVLLRLEADLEWVSASHPQVDLFMINEEFRHSPNIVKLIQSQTQKPVLYISKNDAHSGDGLIGNALTLPLKKLNPLNDWLFDKVAVLRKQSEHHERRESANKSIDNKPNEILEATVPQQKSTKPKKIQPQKSGGFFSPNSQSKTSRESHNQPQATTSQTQFDTLINVMHCLKKGADGTYQLTAANEVIATIEPKRARVWKTDNSQLIIEQHSLKTWNIEPITLTLPNAADAIDLKQWLWDMSWNKESDLIPLIENSRTYRLEHWVKANEKQNKRDVLSIMTAMETVAGTVNQIADKSSTTLEESNRVIACLLFAGYLQPDSYENIKPTIGELTSNKPAAIPSEPEVNLSPLERVLSERAAGVGKNNQPSSNIPTNITSSAATQAQPEKLGFLGRLRRKLGL